MTKIDMAGVGEYIRDQRSQAKMSLRQLADSAGVSNPYLSQVERGLRKPSAEILSQIAKGLRISAETLYVKAGILEETGTSNVMLALATDDGLTDRQRQMLREIYTAFKAENEAKGLTSTTDTSQQRSNKAAVGTTTAADDSALPGRAFESLIENHNERDD